MRRELTQQRIPETFRTEIDRVRLAELRHTRVGLGSKSALYRIGIDIALEIAADVALWRALAKNATAHGWSIARTVRMACVLLCHGAEGLQRVLVGEGEK